MVISPAQWTAKFCCLEKQIEANTLPPQAGHAGEYLTTDGTTPSWVAIPGGGDVSGPASSVDNQLALFSLTTGKLIKAATGSGFVLSTAGVASFVASTGTGSVVLANSPVLVTPNLGTPSAINLANATNLPPASIAGITTIGTNLITQPNVAAIRFNRINADNTVSQLTAAQQATAVVDGNAINPSSTGATTPGTGAFTTVAASGVVTISNSTASTSTTTGALTVAGGLGLALNLQIADTTASTLGVIKKGTLNFFHNYHNPTGGGAIPNGNNIWIGGAGNFTTGSTATLVTQSSNNIGIGASCMVNVTTGADNVGIGVSSLNALTTGMGNFGIGTGTLSMVTTANSNVAVGNAALLTVTGATNTAIGASALGVLTTGSTNVGIGGVAGVFLSDGVTANQTSAGCVFIGNSTRSGASAGATNMIVIGASAIGDGTNTTVIGTSSTTQARIYGNGIFTGFVKTGSGTVTSLTGALAAATAGQGARYMVTDSNASMATGIGNTVVGGGANIVPVYSDGTNWRIG